MTIINDTSVRNDKVRGLTPDQLDAIYAQLRKLIDNWCRQHETKPFALHDLAPCDENGWKGTALQAVFYVSKATAQKTQKQNATNRAGRLLKRVVQNHEYKFEMIKSFPRQYKLVGKK